jgi:hypothetical protein
MAGSVPVDRSSSCCSGRSLPSASVVELALGVDALDAGVDVGLLILVDPAGRDLFGEPVGVDAAGPALLQEVGVVVSAEQGEIANTALNVPSG